MNVLDDFRPWVRAHVYQLEENIKYCSGACDGVKEFESDVKKVR